MEANEERMMGWKADEDEGKRESMTITRGKRGRTSDAGMHACLLRFLNKEISFTGSNTLKKNKKT